MNLFIFLLLRFRDFELAVSVAQREMNIFREKKSFKTFFFKINIKIQIL